MPRPRAIDTVCGKGHPYKAGTGCPLCTRERQNARRRKPKAEFKTCRRGHQYKPEPGKSGCQTCATAYRKEYWATRRRDNPEPLRKRLRERHTERYRTDPEFRAKSKGFALASYKKHREERNAHARKLKQQYAADPSYLAAKREAERVRLESIRQDPAKYAAYRALQTATNHRRRARLRDACSPGVTPQQWEEICSRHANDEGRICCAYCRKPCAVTIDHVVPICRGGRDEPSNVVPACKPCNSSKNDRLLSEWKQNPARRFEAPGPLPD
jgi:5-methylcytosine-specific restriction endonuclease McrA